MDGPREEGSVICCNIITRPTRVPIIPHAGPIEPKVSQNPILSLCLPSILTSSVSRIPLTSSGSVPSTIRRIPFFIKASSRSLAASSKERSPSFLATLDRSIILVIISGILADSVLKIKVKLFSPPMKSGNVTDAIVAMNEPPKVISMDGGSTKNPIAAIPSSPDTIPNITSPRHATIPIKDAISTSTHPFYLQSSCPFANLYYYNTVRLHKLQQFSEYFT